MAPVSKRNTDILLRALGLLAIAAVGMAAIPFDSAKVTLVENHVSIGQVKGDQNSQRPAAVSETVGAHDYISTETESRAELEFKDHSIVRVGQNTIFSFDAASRTLALDKGTMLFYIPHGGGGGQIKTPSLTAAITGTIGKVSRDMILVIKGEISTPWGLVPAGWAIARIDGQIRIFKVNPASLTDGTLYALNGLLPGAPVPNTEPWNNETITKWLHDLDIRETNTLNPSADQILLIKPPVTPKGKPKPTPQGATGSTTTTTSTGGSGIIGPSGTQGPSGSF